MLNKYLKHTQSISCFPPGQELSYHVHTSLYLEHSLAPGSTHTAHFPHKIPLVVYILWYLLTSLESNPKNSAKTPYTLYNLASAFFFFFSSTGLYPQLSTPFLSASLHMLQSDAGIWSQTTLCFSSNTWNLSSILSCIRISMRAHPLPC